jgi:hypothetical protein
MVSAIAIGLSPDKSLKANPVINKQLAAITHNDLLLKIIDLTI